MQLYDAVTLSDGRVTNDGYYVVNARIARTGIQVYSGDEVGKPELSSVRVLRPDEEVFHASALASFAHRPVTVDHPNQRVTAANWRQFAVGNTGDHISKDGGFVRVPLTLMDGAAIDIVKSGKRELSCGYTCDLKWEAGTTADGQEYDAIQTNIRGNHLAIVGEGRAGNECRIGDNKEHREMTLKSMTIDGISVEMTDTAAQVVGKLQASFAEAVANNLQLQKDHATAIGLKDKELGTKDAEILDLKAKVIDETKLDEIVAVRSVVIDAAKKLLPKADFKGKALNDIRREAVTSKVGAEKLAGKSDEYVEALFDVLAVDAKPSGSDPFKQVAAEGFKLAENTDSREAAYNDRNKFYVDAWKGEVSKGA